MLLIGATAPVVLANHSLPVPAIYWDCDNNAIPDDGCAKGKQAGIGWNFGYNTAMTAAFDEWRTDTQFDPTWTGAGGTGQPMYIDRDAPCLGDFNPGTPPGVNGFYLAVVCVNKQWKGGPEYYRLIGTPTYFNWHLFEVGYSWWLGAGAPNAGTLHFRGTAVHELGHWILLNDLACAPGVTMCHNSENEQDTFDQVTLEADDISGANVVY